MEYKRRVGRKGIAYTVAFVLLRFLLILKLLCDLYVPSVLRAPDVCLPLSYVTAKVEQMIWSDIEETPVMPNLKLLLSSSSNSAYVNSWYTGHTYEV